MTINNDPVFKNSEKKNAIKYKLNAEANAEINDEINERKALGIYIHIPFCLQKCNYCDFLSFGGTSPESQAAYIKSMIREIRYHGEIYRNEYYVDSIFIGGGTPSLLEENLIADLMAALKDNFTIDQNAEISIESNLKTLTAKKLNKYLELGINRLSIGAQSFDASLLQFMGRAHSPEDFFTNYSLARECGFQNINIDIMFGIPGQTMAVWKDTFDRALDLEPEHLSFYSLQLEEGTPFFAMHEAGSLKETEEELDRDMYHYALSALKNRGYEHYEISNAARPGSECRHNLKYWSMEDYLGIGLGAHSFIDGMRFSNLTDLSQYIKAEMPKQVFNPYIQWQHENTKEDNISEYLFTGLRKMNGIDLMDFRQRFGVALENLYEQVLQKYLGMDLIEIKEGKLRFTEQGIDISNTVLAEFV